MSHSKSGSSHPTLLYPLAWMSSFTEVVLCAGEGEKKIKATAEKKIHNDADFSHVALQLIKYYGW